MHIQWNTTQPLKIYIYEIMPLATTWMATTDYHTKWGKQERKRQIPCDIIYMWNLQYNTGGGAKMAEE